MATIKPRINITLPYYTKRVLALVAQRDHVPEATKATHLLELALEIEEDQVWDSIAKRRDTKKTKFISHKNAWS